MVSVADSKLMLVVDDDLSFVTFVCTALGRLGVRHAVALSGAEAIRYLSRSQPSGVLLDLNLPDIGGLDLLRHIRQRGKLVPVVVLTGAGSVPAAVDAMRLGALDFVEKPVRVGDLSRVVWTLLSHSPTVPQSPNVDQLARAMMAVVQCAEDVPTVRAWGVLVGKSRSSMYALCEMVGVLAKAALDLARLLRAARCSVTPDLRDTFFVADPRTVNRLLRRAGYLAGVGGVHFRDDLLINQRLVTDHRVIERLTHYLTSAQ